jgi:hypothetical protein
MRYATFVALILVGVTGCATLQAAATRSDERVLAAAGFHMQLADTPERVAELQSLPPRTLMSRPHNGGVSYVFSDPAGCHCLYVGGDREYQEYQRLRLDKERALEKQRVDDDSGNCWGWPWCNGYGG